MRQPLRIQRRFLLSGLLALCLALGALFALASAAGAQGALPLPSKTATATPTHTATATPTPSPTPTEPTVGGTFGSPTATAAPPSRKAGTFAGSTPSSNSFFPTSLLGIPTTFIALGTLVTLIILVFVMGYLLQVRARHRAKGTRQPLAAPVSPMPAQRTGAQLRQANTPPRPAQQERAAHGEAVRPAMIKPPTSTSVASAAGVPEPTVQLPPAAGTVFCPECGLQQEIGTGPCRRCGFDLGQALTRVRASDPSRRPMQPSPPTPAALPTPLGGLLPFAVLPADPKQSPGQEAPLKSGPLSGQVLGGKYLLEALLGRGGIGVVYKASNQLLKRPQAIKVLLEHYLDDEKFRERFLREAQVLAALDHPNILPVHDFGIEEERAYLVMPFISGGTLDQWLKRHPGPVDPEQTRRAVQHIAAALDYAHTQGVVHLDLKPANILLHLDGRLLLSDFGLAHLMEAGAIEGGTSLQFGTPAYMAPEHIQGAPGPASDIYALGIMLYQLLTGQLPFQGSNPRALLHRQATEPPPPLRVTRPDLPVRLEGVLAKALAKEPAARYPTAGNLLLAFQTAISP